MPQETQGSLGAFIQALPKTETHLHIEGALQYDELLRTLSPERYPADPQFRRSSYRYPTFPDFERTLLDHALPWFTSAQRYHEAARVIFSGGLLIFPTDTVYGLRRRPGSRCGCSPGS